MSNTLHVSPGELRGLLVDRLGLVTNEDFELAVSMARRFRMPLEEALAERCRVPLKFILEQLAALWQVKYTDLGVSEINREALAHIREDYARAHVLVPFAMEQNVLSVAMANPRDEEALHELEALDGVTVVPYLAPEHSIHRALLLYRGNLLDLVRQTLEEGRIAKKSNGNGANPNSDSATRLLNRILDYAAVTEASDIHIEPYEFETLVRFRIDGVLHEVLSESPEALLPLTTRIKALARMRIDDRRSPQDGRFDGDLGAFQLDLRVSSLPSHWGEKIVMRVLAKEHMTVDLEALGLANGGYSTVVRNLTRPHGMILVTGPTGCGKSTTLYAMLARLGSERLNLVNISTIEDPVERPLPRVTQVDLNPLAGMDYASGLRALLRQDPDVIMIGEVRDRETMELAIRSALVGRLMLSTLHTNDAPTAIPRLLDMGAEPYLVASTLSLVVAQRLARRVCMHCRESIPDSSAEMSALRNRADFAQAIAALHKDGLLREGDDQLDGVRLFRGRGCPMCKHSGYHGRIGLFEILEVNDEVRRMILERRDTSLIRRAAMEAGMRTMFQDGLSKVLLGETTVSELLRVAA
jgi:type IV pilus assembly protein PilB